MDKLGNTFICEREGNGVRRHSDHNDDQRQLEMPVDDN